MESAGCMRVLEEYNEFLKNITGVSDIYNGECQRYILRFDGGIW